MIGEVLITNYVIPQFEPFFTSSAIMIDELEYTISSVPPRDPQIQ